MLVGDWMSTNVSVTTEDASMMRAGKIMKEKRVRRLPVVDKDNRLVGVVTERDIMKASPSGATTLDMYEMTYLLSEIKVKSIMTAKPVAIKAADSVEKAAMIMRDKKIGGLPVVDADCKVVGIITDTDIFRLLISITGIDLGGVQIGFQLDTAEGSLKPIMDDLRRYGARIISVLSAYDRAVQGRRTVYIRIHTLASETEKQLSQELSAKYKVLYWTRDGEEAAG